MKLRIQRIRRLGLGLLAVFPLLTAGACEREPEGPLYLVDHEMWTEVSAQDDPFDDRPDEVNCNSLSWGPESIGELALEVEMATCDYLTGTQPSLVSVSEGDLLKVRVWHNQLVGPPGQTHLAVMLGDTLLWEVRHEIPGGAALDSVEWESDFDAPAGTPIYFHVHNHGANTYYFIELTRTAL